MRFNLIFVLLGSCLQFKNKNKIQRKIHRITRKKARSFFLTNKRVQNLKREKLLGNEDKK